MFSWIFYKRCLDTVTFDQKQFEHCFGAVAVWEFFFKSYRQFIYALCITFTSVTISM